MIDKDIQDIIEKRQLLIQENEELEQSAEYLSQNKEINTLMFDFFKLIQTISIAITRAGEDYTKNSLFSYVCDEMLSSICSIVYQFKENMHNSSKRELRFLMELILLTNYFDRNYTNIDDKFQVLQKFRNHNFRENIVDKINDIFPNNLTLSQELVNSVKDYYTQLCKYTHFSKEQLGERIRKNDNQLFIGFESISSREKAIKFIQKIIDILIIYIFDNQKIIIKESLDIFKDKELTLLNGKFTKSYIESLKSY